MLCPNATGPPSAIDPRHMLPTKSSQCAIINSYRVNSSELSKVRDAEMLCDKQKAEGQRRFEVEKEWTREISAL